MKVFELRIGNWIEGVDGICQITEILKNGVNVTNPDDTPPHYFDWIEPIPLTEEWLLKFGFENKGRILSSDVISYVNKFGAEVRHYTEYRFFIPELRTGIWIQYIHQLQNLYFALTGEELTIH